MITAATAAEPLAPGSRIGILGGGQLGRMLALAAARLGFQSHILCPDCAPPAAQVAATFTQAEYDDRTALEAFSRQVDVVTYEFENVPVAAARILNDLVPVRPSPDALAIAQDRFFEKTFVQNAGIATARFTAVSTEADLEQAVAGIGLPAVLKTRRLGYDGKGQERLDDLSDAGRAWNGIRGAAAILESFVPFVCELSMISARGMDGRVVSYDCVRNVHEGHVLARSTVPAGISLETADAARGVMERIVEQLEYVGVIGVELFLCADGSLLVNEIAPRVHNSGHWTLDACVVSQFEQHIRAICGWPLGSVRRHSDVVMVNLLGDAVERWSTLSEEPDTALHIYGKGEALPGRKMGHKTHLFPLGDVSASDTVPGADPATRTPRAVERFSRYRGG